MKKLILAAIITTATTGALAQDDAVYITAGLHFGNYEESFQGDDFSWSPKALNLKVGKYINKNFAVEGAFLLGMDDDTDNMYGYDVIVELKSAFSLFLKPIAPVNDNVSFYGLLGVTQGTLAAELDGFSDSSSENGLSYGVGMQVLVGTNNLLSVEYINYLDEDAFNYSGINFNFGGKF